MSQNDEAGSGAGFVVWGSGLLGALERPLLLDAGGFSGESAEVVDAGAAHATHLYDLNGLEERAGNREHPFHTDAGSHFAHRKCGRWAFSAALDDDTLEDLGALLRALLDLVADLDGITSLELGPILNGNELLGNLTETVHDAWG